MKIQTKLLLLKKQRAAVCQYKNDLLKAIGTLDQELLKQQSKTLNKIAKQK